MQATTTSGINVAAVIPTFNRKKELTELLDQIEKQQSAAIQIWPIIAVDGSTDGTLEILKSSTYKNLHFVEGPGDWWYTKSINQGFSEAIRHDPDFILTLNDDCILDENYFESLLKSYDKLEIPNAIIGSTSFSVEEPIRLIFAGIKNIQWWRYKVKYYYPKNSIMNPESISGLHESHSLPGRGILIPTSTLQTVGFFNESFVQYYSDSEFIFRARKMGIPVYVNHESRLYTYLSKTGQGSVYNREPLMTFLKNFINPYSRNYINNIVKIIWMYGNKPLLPFTLVLKIMGHLKNYIRGKE